MRIDPRTDLPILVLFGFLLIAAAALFVLFAV